MSNTNQTQRMSENKKKPSGQAHVSAMVPGAKKSEHGSGPPKTASELPILDTPDAKDGVRTRSGSRNREESHGERKPSPGSAGRGEGSRAGRSTSTRPVNARDASKGNGKSTPSPGITKAKGKAKDVVAVEVAELPESDGASMELQLQSDNNLASTAGPLSLADENTIDSNPEKVDASMEN